MGLCGSKSAPPPSSSPVAAAPGDWLVEALVAGRAGDEARRLALDERAEAASSALAARVGEDGGLEGLVEGGAEVLLPSFDDGLAELPAAGPAVRLAHGRAGCTEAAWLANALMEAVAEQTGATLSRFDLWHAHAVWNEASRALVLVFHAREYPRLNVGFPHDLGPCQASSDLQYDADAMRSRNSVLVATRESASLWQLDAADATRTGRELASPGAPFFTVPPASFGRYLGDVYRLPYQPLAWCAQRDPSRAACSLARAPLQK